MQGWYTAHMQTAHICSYIAHTMHPMHILRICLNFTHSTHVQYLTVMREKYMKHNAHKMCAHVCRIFVRDISDDSEEKREREASDTHCVTGCWLAIKQVLAAETMLPLHTNHEYLDYLWNYDTANLQQQW